MPIPIDGGVVHYRKPDPSGKAGGLGDKLEKSLQRFLVGVLEDNDEAIAHLASFAGETLLENLEQGLIPAFTVFADFIVGQPECPDDVKALINRYRKPQSQIEIIIMLSIIGMALGPIIGGVLQPISTKLSQAIDHGVRSALPSTGDAARMSWRGEITPDMYQHYDQLSGIPDVLHTGYEAILRPVPDLGSLFEYYRRTGADWKGVIEPQLRTLGYRIEDIATYGLIVDRILDVEPIIRAHFREEITESEALDRLTKLGYTTSNATLILKTSRQLPGVADLVTMAVREAWRDDIAATWGYDEAFPTEFADAIAKMGFDPDWATRYWRSHWRLPSVTLGFEMLHRGIIGEPELTDLLKISDYPAGWRQKMTDVAYTPFTRVDVRRMYKVGVLNEEQVFRSYLDLGYDAEKAQAMTDFTILYNSTTDTSKVEEAKALTRSVIEGAYRKDVITRPEAETRLGDLEYTAEDIDMLLSMVDVQRELEAIPDYLEDYQRDLQKVVLRSYTARMIGSTQAKEYLLTVGLTEPEIELQLAIADFSYSEMIRAKEIEIIGEAYVKRAIDRTTALEKLGRLALPSDQQEVTLSGWALERDLRTRRLTESQYRKALKDEIITPDQYVENMRGLGYSESDIEILVKMAIPTVEE